MSQDVPRKKEIFWSFEACCCTWKKWILHRFGTKFYENVTHAQKPVLNLYYKNSQTKVGRIWDGSGMDVAHSFELILVKGPYTNIQMRK